MHEPILSYRDQHELNVNALLVFLIASVYAVHYQLHNTKNTSRTPKTYFSSAQLFTFTHTCPRWLYGLCYNCVRIRQHNIGLSRNADSITTPVQSRHWSIPGNSPLVTNRNSYNLCAFHWYTIGGLGRSWRSQCKTTTGLTTVSECFGLNEWMTCLILQVSAPGLHQLLACNLVQNLV